MASANPAATFQKDPNAILDYTLDWSAFLNGDIIATVTWTLPGGIASVGQVFSSATATIWLSGGSAGTSYGVVCLITTVGGRTDERTIQLNVVSR